jgi:hypothetical protein
MKTLKFFFASMCVLAIVASSVAQVQTRKSPGVLGYLDPRTGSFHTLPVPDSDAAEVQPPTTFGGSFVVSFTISVKSAIASTAKIACSVSAITIDNIASGAPNIIEEEAAVLATRSGTSATCTVTIPYSWNLATATSDKVTLTYVLSAPAEATATTAFPQRLSTQTIATIAVPANGKTTDETVTATF